MPTTLPVSLPERLQFALEKEDYLLACETFEQLAAQGVLTEELHKAQIDTTSRLIKQGVAAYQAGNYGAAASAFAQALYTFEPILGAGHQTTANLLTLMASALAEGQLLTEDQEPGDFSELVGQLRREIAQENWTAALRLSRCLRNLTRRFHGPEHLDHADSLYNLGIVWEGLEEARLAEEYFTAAGELYRDLEGEASYRLGMCLHELGKLYLKEKAEAESVEQCLLGSLGIASQYEQDPLELRLANLQLLGAFYYQESRWEETVQALSQVVPVLEARKDPHVSPAAAALAEAQAHLEGNPDQPSRRWSELNEQLQAAFAAENWSQAQRLVETAKELVASQWGDASQAFAQCLYYEGALAQRLHRFAAAKAPFSQAKTILETLGRTNQADYAHLLSTYANVLQELAEYAEAEALFSQAHTLFDRDKSLTDSPSRFFLLHNHGTLAYKTGRYELAAQLWQQATQLAETQPDQALLPTVLASQASLYMALGNWPKAVSFGQAQLDVLAGQGKADSPDAALGYLNLGYASRHSGRYQEAEAQFRRAAALASGPDDWLEPVEIMANNGLGTLWTVMGRFVEAEQIMAYTLKEVEEAYGASHPYAAQVLQNLGLLYLNLRQWEKADSLLSEAARVQAAATGKQHPEYFITALNQLLLGLQTGRFQAVKTEGEALQAPLAETLGPQHHLYLMLQGHLATAYSRLGDYAQAEACFQQTLAAREEQFGATHPESLLVKNNLAVLYQRSGDFRRAIAEFEQLKPLVSEHLPPAHPLHSGLSMSLARSYGMDGQPEAAGEEFIRCFQLVEQEAERQFKGLSEAEKRQYLAQVQQFIHVFLSFCLQYPAQQAQMAGLAFDLQLLYKGLLLDRSQHWRREIRRQENPELTAVYEQWLALREELAWAYRQPLEKLAEARFQLELKEQSLRGLEKQLVWALPFAEGARLSWEALQAQLAPEEAAVELVRFEEHGEHDWTGVHHYAALLLRPESPAPKLVMLPLAGEEEETALARFRDFFRQDRSGRRSLEWETAPQAEAELLPPELYAQLLGPILAELEGVHTLFLAPDGLYQQLPLGLLPHPDGGYVGDRLDLRLLTATRQLLRPSVSRLTASPKALLLGDPAYDLDPMARQQQLEALGRAPQPSLRATGGELGQFAPLPGTAAEVQQIAPLLTSQGWETEVRLGPDALEEVLKAGHACQLLHLATHGFFLPQTGSPAALEAFSLNAPGAENPLLRSGLAFAGANHRTEDQEAEDGLLFAYELAQVDLSQTELVVLSACETGLGEVEAGEGVYGLGRACQLAGARFVIVSLWQVDDAATSELMTAFYQHWLQGLTPHEALKKAQTSLRKTYPHPYYWGAFQVLGG